MVVSDPFECIHIDNFKILQTWFCLEEAFELVLAERMWVEEGKTSMRLC